MHFDVYPAGDIYLTAEDMARYLGAQLNGGVFNGNRILSEESVREMHKPRFGGDYGFGFWMVHDSATGHTLIHHGGAIAGQRAFLIGDLDATRRRLLHDQFRLPPRCDAARAIGDRVCSAQAVARRELRPSACNGRASRWTTRCSTATSAPTSWVRRTLVVSRVGRALALQQNGQPAINELLAETPVRFFQRGSNIAITFEGDGGRIDRLVVEAGAQRLTATRRK